LNSGSVKTKMCKNVFFIPKAFNASIQTKGSKMRLREIEPRKQGCQIFYGKQFTKLPQNILNGHKIYQMAIKISNSQKNTKWP
jgi:hypothetical protein